MRDPLGDWVQFTYPSLGELRLSNRQKYWIVAGLKLRQLSIQAVFDQSKFRSQCLPGHSIISRLGRSDFPMPILSLRITSRNMRDHELDIDELERRDRNRDSMSWARTSFVQVTLKRIEHVLHGISLVSLFSSPLVWPVTFVVVVALAGAFSGAIIVGAIALLQLPIYFVLKYWEVLPKVEGPPPPRFVARQIAKRELRK